MLETEGDACAVWARMLLGKHRMRAHDPGSLFMT